MLQNKRGFLMAETLAAMAICVLCIMMTGAFLSSSVLWQNQQDRNQAQSSAAMRSAMEQEVDCPVCRPQPSATPPAGEAF